MLAFAAAVATVLAMLLGLVYRLDDLAAHVEDDVISAARALVGSAPRAPAAPAVLQQSRPTPPSRASSQYQRDAFMRGSSRYHVLQPGDRHTALDLTQGC